LSFDVRLPRISGITAWASARCNLRCEYCYVYRLYPNQPNKDLNEEALEALIEFASRNKPFSIHWFGGEPLLAWDNVIVRAVELAEKKGLKIPNDIKFSLTTNLTLLDEKKLEFIKKYNIGLLISIDGTKEKHDRHRKFPSGKGSWDIVWKNLKLVRKYYIGTPELRWTVSPETLPGLADDVKFFVENGLTNLAIDPVFECEWYEEDYETYRREMVKLRGYVIQWLRRGIPVYLMPVRRGLETIYGLRNSWKFRCGLAQANLGMDINGDLYPCHRFVSSHDKRLVLGNIKDLLDPEGYEKFEEKRIRFNQEWWKAPPFNADDLSMCDKCIFRNGCMGGCLAINYDMYGDIHKIPTTFCRISQISAEVFLPLHQLMIYENNQIYINLYFRRPMP